jgi:carbonic anhydrase
MLYIQLIKVQMSKQSNMSNLKTLIDRSSTFKNSFSNSELPALPKYRTVILTCADARVDPAHIFSLDLGDSVVIRNTGGRVTSSTLEEIATLAFMVGKMDEAKGEAEVFEIIILHHTHCGAQRFADPEFQKALKTQTGVDVSSLAITDHIKSLQEDIHRLIEATNVPDHVIVSGSLYDVKTGETKMIFEPNQLRELRMAIL